MTEEEFIEIVKRGCNPSDIHLGHTWVKRKLLEAFKEYQRKKTKIETEE